MRSIFFALGICLASLVCGPAHGDRDRHDGAADTPRLCARCRDRPAFTTCPVPTVGSHLSPYRRSTSDVPNNILNRFALHSLDHAIAAIETTSTRIYLSVPAASIDESQRPSVKALQSGRSRQRSKKCRSVSSGIGSWSSRRPIGRSTGTACEQLQGLVFSPSRAARRDATRGIKGIRPRATGWRGGRDLGGCSDQARTFLESGGSVERRGSRMATWKSAPSRKSTPTTGRRNTNAGDFVLRHSRASPCPQKNARAHARQRWMPRGLDSKIANSHKRRSPLAVRANRSRFKADSARFHTLIAVRIFANHAPSGQRHRKEKRRT